MGATPLCTLAEKYRSDKCPSIHHTYTPFYYDLLKNVPVTRMLEIGIGSHSTMPYAQNYSTAAGLRMWADFFPNAEVIGIDIADDSLVNEGTVSSYICNQADEQSLINFGLSRGPFDLIVDDGSHDKDHQVLGATTLMRFVRHGGFYIIEDVEFLDYVTAKLAFPYEIYVGPRVGCGVSDNNLIIMRKS